MVIAHRIRPGDYRDSIQLMQLQGQLEESTGVLEAMAMMATPGNLDLLREGGWSLPETPVGPNDLVALVKAETSEAAGQALDRIDEMLLQRGRGVESEYRPRSLEAAVKQLPEAGWVVVSVPGQHAAAVTRRALELDRSVFLFSDNVPLEDEASLKRESSRRGLLLMGPDCGTAIVNGVGLGFANRVRRGSVGLVGSSGTGLQLVTSRIHALGGGVSHAIGVGGRDLHDAVGAVSTLQAFDLLERDPETEVIVLLGKPPQARAATQVLARARWASKPVAACFLGFAPPAREWGAVHFASNLTELAALAVGLSGRRPERSRDAAPTRRQSSRRFLRGLFAGGTLATECLERLRWSLQPIHSNLKSEGARKLANLGVAQGHMILDLGDDAFTVGQPHPMLEPEILARRLEKEAGDPETALILFDVVLGDGAHANPAGRLEPVIARRAGQGVEFIAVIVGTDQDPQDASAVERTLGAAGVTTFRDLEGALTYVEARLGVDLPGSSGQVPLEVLRNPVATINVGIELLFESLQSQGVPAVQMDWRPPAGGNAALASLLERMRKK